MKGSTRNDCDVELYHHKVLGGLHLLVRRGAGVVVCETYIKHSDETYERWSTPDYDESGIGAAFLKENWDRIEDENEVKVFMMMAIL